jgi:hypothetical protein
VTDSDLERVEAALHDINLRLLFLEKTFGIPIPYVDKILADTRHAQRMRGLQGATLGALTALSEAKAEAERTGSRRPIDEFVARLKAGEFEPGV